MSEKIKEFIKKCEIPLIVSFLIGIAQAINYLLNTSYYNYFNINSSLININPLNGIIAIVIFAIKAVLLLCEIYLLYEMFMLIYNNRKNLKKNYSILKRIKIITIALILTIIGFQIFNNIINYCLTKEWQFEWKTTLICSLTAIVVCFAKIRITLFKNKESREEETIQLGDYILLILILCSISIVIINEIINIGINNAQNQKTFLINVNENKIILYNDQNTSIIANYDYNEKDHSITIYTDELEKINNDNMKFTTKTFNEVVIKH